MNDTLIFVTGAIVGCVPTAAVMGACMASISQQSERMGRIEGALVGTATQAEGVCSKNIDDILSDETPSEATNPIESHADHPDYEVNHE